MALRQRAVLKGQSLVQKKLRPKRTALGAPQSALETGREKRLLEKGGGSRREAPAVRHGGRHPAGEVAGDGGAVVPPHPPEEPVTRLEMPPPPNADVRAKCACVWGANGHQLEPF